MDSTLLQIINALVSASTENQRLKAENDRLKEENKELLARG